MNVTLGDVRLGMRVMLAWLVLAGVLAMSGCGESGKDLALKRDEAAAGEQLRERLTVGQTDR